MPKVVSLLLTFCPCVSFSLCFLYIYIHPSIPLYFFINFNPCALVGTCTFPPLFSSVPTVLITDIRLRVRAEYSEHESALRARVSSDKQQPLERQFELFSRASTLLRTRDLGSIVCDIKFSELQNLDAFWADYLSGALLEALKGVFITDSLKRAAGQEGVRLLVSVDQDDYEEGRKLLLDYQMTTNSPVLRPWEMARTEKWRAERRDGPHELFLSKKKRPCGIWESVDF